MLKRSAALPSREDSDVGRLGLIDSQAIADALGFRGDRHMDQEDWLSHVRAGEMYNRHVARTNMRRYFTPAEQDVLAHGSGRCAEEPGQLGYVVPGDEPSGQPDCSAYRAALDRVKLPDDSKQAVAGAYLVAYILTAGERAARDAKR